MSVQFIQGWKDYQPKNNRGSVVTVGTFDGIHRGHQEILKRVRTAADSTGLNPVLVTFHPHPRVVISPNQVPMLLTSIEEKKQFVPDFFDGEVLILDFNAELKEMTAEKFTSEILVETLNMKHLIVGYDHVIGRDRGGDVSLLRQLGEKHGYEVEKVEPILENNQPISSSRIREALAGGEFAQALSWLGHEYAICGVVERGIGLGRKLGYPTANIRYSMRKLLPTEGVYACWNEVGSEVFPGMMFIGQNHFNPEARITVESNLFDFDRDIYDQEMVVYPTEFVRKSEHFDSTDKLVEQLERDKTNVNNILGKGKQLCR